MNFDRTARLNATDAMSLDDLLNQFGDVGSRNGPRRGPERRSTVSNEAYLARRLILNWVETGKLTFPITVLHQDGPDFVVQHAGGVEQLEVTEVCPASDGHLRANESDDVRPIGVYAESGDGQGRSDLLQQMQDGVDRKRTKQYASDGQLNVLLYPNSEAGLWVRLFDKENYPVEWRGLRTHPLKSVWVLWGDIILEIDSAVLVETA